MLSMTYKGNIAFACYRPKPGKEEDLNRLMKTHVQRLRDFGLATDRRPIAVRAQDGTVIEVFEWVSTEAIEKAHSHPGVLEMWNEYDACCTYVPLDQLEESHDLFACFEPL